MQTDYTFISVWHIHAPIEKVWTAIFNSTGWPVWWKGVVAVRSIKIDVEHKGVGSVVEYKWKSFLPYTLTFQTAVTKVVENGRLEGKATGELEGIGIWSFSEKNSITTARYEWRVNINKPLLKALSPFMRAIFIWNHNLIMKQGEIGLQKLLSES